MDGGIQNTTTARVGEVSPIWMETAPAFPPFPPSMAVRELEAEITELAGHLNAGNYRWLSLIAEFDNRNGWVDWATQSCAHWLNWKIGITMGAAREKVRVAHALEKLPKISASMEKGELSYYKVRELTRIATPATEDMLLMIAQYGTAHHIEKTVRLFRRAKEAEELSREEQQQANRYCTYHFDDDGSLVIKARLPAEAGAVVLKALNLAMEEANSQERKSVGDERAPSDVPPGTPNVKSTPRMKRADGLALMAESFLQHGAEEMNGGDKYQIVVHVSEEVLSSAHPEPVEGFRGQCEFEGGASIAAETARRLACDCSVVHVFDSPAGSPSLRALDRNGDPLDFGRKTRSIPPALRRVLNARDKGCRFPGCCNKSYVDGHHINHWANGGETKLSNLVTLCRFHHHLVHEGGVHIQVLDDGALRFLKPDGTQYDQVVRISTDWTQLSLQHQEYGIHIDGKTAATRWRGEKMDYGLGVQVLLQREARATKNVPSGTF